MENIIEASSWKEKKKQYNIHIQFTIFAHQGFVYEVSCRFEVLTEVKVLWILRWDAKVNAGVPIKTLVTNAALLGVRCVQDMSDAKLMQCLFILCYSPVDMEKDGKKRVKLKNRTATSSVYKC